MQNESDEVHFCVVPSLYSCQKTSNDVMTSQRELWLPYLPEFVEKPFREWHMFLFINKCLTFDLSGDLRDRERPQGEGLFHFSESGLNSSK